MKKLFSTLCCLTLGLTLVGCASNAADQAKQDSTANDSGNVAAASSSVADSDVSAAIADPDSHDGESISIEGATYAQGAAADGKTTWFAYHDPYQLSEPFAFTASDIFNVDVGEYVRIEGTISGTTTQTAETGETTTMTLINADNVEVLSAWDGMSSSVSESTITHDIS